MEHPRVIPGPTGYGVVIRDNTGKIKHLRVGFLGHDMNNSVELWGLIKGLQLSLSLNLQPLIIEGDSKSSSH
jgi:ribonuclease HI